MSEITTDEFKNRLKRAGLIVIGSLDHSNLKIKLHDGKVLNFSEEMYEDSLEDWNLDGSSSSLGALDVIRAIAFPVEYVYPENLITMKEATSIKRNLSGVITNFTPGGWATTSNKREFTLVDKSGNEVALPDVPESVRFKIDDLKNEWIDAPTKENYVFKPYQDIKDNIKQIYLESGLRQIEFQTYGIIQSAKTREDIIHTIHPKKEGQPFIDGGNFNIVETVKVFLQSFEGKNVLVRSGPSVDMEGSEEEENIRVKFRIRLAVID